MTRLSVLGLLLAVLGLLHLLGIGGEVTIKQLLGYLLIFWADVIFRFKAIYEDL